MIVDHQAHWYPPGYFESILDRDRYPRASRQPDGGYLFEPAQGDFWPMPRHFVDLDMQLADMDEHGIDVIVVSPTLVADVCGLEIGEARATLDVVHEEMARAQNEHPDRFVGLAMLPMQDTVAAIEVLDHAIGELGLKGVCVVSNIDGRPIATPETLPIYARIAELGVPLFLHPAHHSMMAGGGLDLTIEIGAAWMFDTTAAALALVYGGVLDACPELVVVHPHMGGTLPYIAGRVSETEINAINEQPLSHYLTQRFYVDSVSSTPGALRLARETYGDSRILYATDYPWIGRAEGRRYVDENLDAASSHAVLHENRVDLLTLPAGA